MNYKLLHIFQNTRFGRETFLQSLYFCKTVDTFPAVYIPKSEKFLMYFSNDAVQVNLDASYLRSPDTARGNAVEIADEMGVQISFYEPKNFTASSLPDLFMLAAAGQWPVIQNTAGPSGPQSPADDQTCSLSHSHYKPGVQALEEYFRFLRRIKKRNECVKDRTEGVHGIGAAHEYLHPG